LLPRTLVAPNAGRNIRRKNHDSCIASPHLHSAHPRLQIPGHVARNYRCLPMTMDLPASPRPRKRRAINACVSCRASKVRCDGNRPCQRCDRNSATCQYFDAVKDENVLRIERLEKEVAALRELELVRAQQHRVKSVRITKAKSEHRGVSIATRFSSLLTLS
jgi:hypothetical protein